MYGIWGKEVGGGGDSQRLPLYSHIFDYLDCRNVCAVHIFALYALFSFLKYLQKYIQFEN